MKNLLIAALLPAASLFAQEKADDAFVPPPITTEQLTAEGEAEKLGFAKMFAGDSMEGWERRGSAATYKIKNGILYGVGQDLRGNSFLCSKDTYGDFIFVFQFQFGHLEGNSGCMFRALQREDGRVNGYQCEHDNRTRAWTAGIYDEARRGWIYPTKEKDSLSARKLRDEFTGQGNRIFQFKKWNTVVIRCFGNHIQTWLNGELRVDFKDTHPEHTTLEGFFGFQVHGGAACDVRWKDIYLKQL